LLEQPKQCGVLAEQLGINERSIRYRAKKLKALGLIRSNRGRGGGYEITPKGRKLLEVERRILLEMYAKTRLEEEDYLYGVEPEFMEEADKAQKELARRADSLA